MVETTQSTVDDGGFRHYITDMIMDPAGQYRVSSVFWVACACGGLASGSSPALAFRRHLRSAGIDVKIFEE